MTANFIRALAVKSFDIPDKKRCPDKAEFDLVTVDDYSVARLILDDQAPDEDAVDKPLTPRPRAPEAGKEGSAIPLLMRGTEWGDRRDSNPRPSGPQPMFRVRPSRKGLAR